MNTWSLFWEFRHSWSQGKSPYGVILRNDTCCVKLQTSPSLRLTSLRQRLWASNHKFFLFLTQWLMIFVTRRFRCHTSDLSTLLKIKLNWLRKRNFSSRNKNKNIHSTLNKSQHIFGHDWLVWASALNFRTKRSEWSPTSQLLLLLSAKKLFNGLDLLLSVWMKGLLLSACLFLFFYFIATHNCPCSMNHHFANCIRLIASVFAGSQKIDAVRRW